jgi:hypothetical protein
MADEETPLSQHIPDPYEGYSSQDIGRAYAQAAHTHNTAAMEQLHKAHLAAMKREDAVAYDPTSGMGPEQKLMAGMGHAFVRGGEGLANLVGLGPSKENLKEEDKQAQALLNTGWGRGGDIAGQVIESLPLGMGTGAGLRAAGVIGKAGAPAALATATRLGKFLPNTIRALTAAGEGGLQGAVYADPDKVGESAGYGAVLGGTLGKLGQVGGRITRGIVEQSPAATALIQAAKDEGKNLFLPISQAAKSGFGLSGAAKGFYQHMLPYAIGVESQLKGQSAKAAEESRTVAANLAMRDLKDPKTGEPWIMGSMEGKTAEHTARNLETTRNQLIKDNFDDLGFQIPFSDPNVPGSTFRDGVIASLKRSAPDLGDEHVNALADEMDGIMQRAAKKGEEGYISGRTLRAAIDEADEKGGQLAKAFKMPEAGPVASQSFRDLIDIARANADSTIKRSEGTAQGQAALEFRRHLDNYRILSIADPDVQNVLRNTEGAAKTRGAYDVGELATPENLDTPFGDFSRNYAEVMSQTPASVNPAGRAAYHTLIGGLPGGIHGYTTGDPWGGLTAGLGTETAASVAGNLAATRPTQNFLTGRGLFGGQQALAEWLRQNPQTAYSTGLGLRTAAGEERE